MSLNDATYRLWATPIKANEWNACVLDPYSVKATVEDSTKHLTLESVIARLLNSEESNLEAIVNVAQELWNRRRYRLYMGGKRMSWSIKGIKDHGLKYTWYEVLYAGGEAYTPLAKPWGDEGYKNVADPLDIGTGSVDNATITAKWRICCDCANNLVNELMPEIMPWVARHGYELYIDDQLYHVGYGSTGGDRNTALRNFLYQENQLSSPNANWHGVKFTKTILYGGKSRYQGVMLGNSMFFNLEEQASNGIHKYTHVFVPEEVLTDPPKTDGPPNLTRLPDVTATEFIEFLASRVGCGYAYGSYGQMCDDNLIGHLKAKNPQEANNLEVSRTKWRGRYVCDCSGLLKWFFLKKGFANCDTNANGMYRNWCYTTSTDMPHGFGTPGGFLLFRMNNGKAVHVGVYVGNNKIIEAKGAAYGVVVTEYKPNEWDAFGTVGWVYDYIYDDEGPAADLQVVLDASTIASNLGANEAVSGIQSYSTSTSSIIYKEEDSSPTVEMIRRRLWADNPSFVVSDYFDAVLTAAIQSFQAANDLTADGIVGSATWRKLFPILQKKLGVQAGAKAAQTLLNYQNYPVGTPDGMFGTGTETIVKAFQQDHELDADGVIGDKTWEVLALNTPSETQAIVPEAVKCQVGDSGNLVRQIQNRLSMWMYSFPQPGHFDAYTKTKVEAFQNVHGISIDGIVGNTTWDRMFPILKKAYGKHDDVNYLQKALIYQRHMVTADGMFGSGTEEAVKAYQTLRGLTSDGIVGEATWASLFLATPTGLNQYFGSGGSGVSSSSILRYGDQNARVRQVKRRMNVDGLFTGTIDSIFDTALRTAIRNYQYNCGITADGLIGSITWSLLFPVVKKKTGQQDGARAVQALLNLNGYSVGSPDGLFGTGSETKLKQFQAAKGLTADGICGENTWAKLCLI